MQLDGSAPRTLNATRATENYDTLLYSANNIGPGNHTLKVVNQDEMRLEIHEAVVQKVLLSPRYVYFWSRGEEEKRGLIYTSEVRSNLRCRRRRLRSHRQSHKGTPNPAVDPTD